MIHSRKTYYSIREVCEKTDLEPHVLRYWESEFSALRPKKNRAGNRAYREKDIETVQKIKHLLYDEQYTIPGARKKLTELKDTPVSDLPLFNAESEEENCDEIKSKVIEAVEELKQLLKDLE